MDSLLSNAGLEELIPLFHANDIDSIEILSELILYSQNDFEKLIPSIGTRLRLKKIFRENFSDNIKIEFVDETFSAVEEKTDGIINYDTSKTSVDINDEINEETETYEPISKKRKKHSKIENLDLKQILEDHPFGPSIIAIYKYKRQLCSCSQSYLCNIIITHLLKNYGLCIVNEDFEVLAYKIHELFPEECPETYYVAPIRKKDSKNNVAGRSKGKLVDKYRNSCSFIHNANKLLQQQNKINRVMNNINEDLDAAVQSKIWLVTNRNESKLLKHWDASYSLRQSDAENNKYKVVADIFDNWPILKETDQYVLIERDFSKRYKTSVHDFKQNWNILYSKVFELCETKLLKLNPILVEISKSNNSVLNHDSETFNKFQILSLSLAPKSSKICIKKSEKTKEKAKFWKPSWMEAVEGLIIHVKIPGDIEHAVREKRTKMSMLNISVQPFIIIVGEDRTKIEKIYIRIDDVMYEMVSLINAIYLIFQFYIIFNVSYPVESENVCYAIQWAVLNVRTNVDIHIPYVYNTLNKLKLLHNTK